MILQVHNYIGQMIGDEMTHENEEGIGRGILGGVVAQEIEIVIMGGMIETARIGDIVADLAHVREDATDRDRLNEEEDTGTSYAVSPIAVNQCFSRSRS